VSGFLAKIRSTMIRKLILEKNKMAKVKGKKTINKFKLLRQSALKKTKLLTQNAQLENSKPLRAASIVFILF
jgi:hypothetical protein